MVTGHGLVGYDVASTRRRSSVRIRVGILFAGAAAQHHHGEVAERSKALRQGRNLFGGVGSNPTLVMLLQASEQREPRPLIAPLAQWIARWTSNPKVAGSSPAGGMALEHTGTAVVARLAQSVARGSHNPKVVSSILAPRIFRAQREGT